MPIDPDALAALRDNPIFRDALHSVRKVGLHKVAGDVLGMEGPVTLKTAMQEIGKNLFLHHFRQQKIAQGLADYKLLEKLEK